MGRQARESKGAAGDAYSHIRCTHGPVEGGALRENWCVNIGARSHDQACDRQLRLKPSDGPVPCQFGSVPQSDGNVVPHKRTGRVTY